MNKFRLASRRIDVVILTMSFWNSLPVAVEGQNPLLLLKAMYERKGAME